MSRTGRLQRDLTSGWRLLVSAEASQLLEFAVALPLLVVLVVGIFDFGGAFNLKNQLSNAVREGARLGSSLPMSDLTASSIPFSVVTVLGAVDAYLLRSQINDCGLGSATLTQGSTYSWTTTASAGCPGSGLTLTIDRAYLLNPKPNSADVICTHVSITYPYQWHFNSVIQLLVPGATLGGTLQVASEAIMPNME